MLRRQQARAGHALSHAGGCEGQTCDGHLGVFFGSEPTALGGA